ncbi:MAG: circularly permuted type 2 ATP-grasp protein, partial [Sporichthyaceae bacterium]|nr:circularly permuted type 2 ATP-grasp protein [Sporichthyaceae bacterium]
MADLFEGYRLGAAWDEMFAAEGKPRRVYESLYDALHPLSSADLRARADSLARSFLERGVTFDFGGREHPFPLDAVPRVVDAAEWDDLSLGVAQRVRAMEAFLADIYGRARVIEDGVVPHAVVTTSRSFQRAVSGLEPPNGVRIHVAGIDVVRGEDGRFRVLEDNVRVPSGVSYVMENRRAVSQVFPEAFASERIRPVSDYPQRLLAALRAAAPGGVNDPVVVVLTPGVHNSAYFEHALLARTMGVELVEGRDLICVGNRVRMRTTGGERRVDVIYRRVDDEYLDPVQFRPDSVLGCPGVVNAARAGTVTIANAIGNGVADDKLLYTYVPDLVRYYLAEEPVLDNVRTYRLDEDADREEVLDRLDELVVKPVDGSGGKGIVMGPRATALELDALRTQIQLDPRGWIAQPVVQLSTAPTLIGDELRPRHVDLRPFAVNDGSSVWVLPGGLTRVALPEGELIVNSSQGGGSKDTWVLGDP